MNFLRLIRGKDRKGHLVATLRKSGPGVGNFSDITKPMTAERISFIRERARRTAREAVQRQWILSNPPGAIRRLVLR